MVKCALYIGCKNPAVYRVTVKAVAAQPAREVLACLACAARIGSRSPEGPVVDRPGMETRFYAIRPLEAAGHA